MQAAGLKGAAGLGLLGQDDWGHHSLQAGCGSSCGLTRHGTDAHSSTRTGRPHSTLVLGYCAAGRQSLHMSARAVVEPCSNAYWDPITGQGAVQGHPPSLSTQAKSNAGRISQRHMRGIMPQAAGAAARRAEQCSPGCQAGRLAGGHTVSLPHSPAFPSAPGHSFGRW